MKHEMAIFTILGFAVALTLGACGKSRSTPKETKATTKPAAAQQGTKPGSRAGARSVKAAPITYKIVSNDKLGFSIQVPSKAKTLACDQFSCTYSYVLPDGMFEIHVNVAKATGKLDSIADAIRDATLMGQKAIVEKKALPNGDMFLVKAPQGMLQEVWYFAKGPKGKVRAKCSGPAKMLDVVKKVCKSLKAK